MTDIEKRAWKTLSRCSMRLSSSGKRFRRDLDYQITADPEFKFTPAQALYMWKLLHLYRRQVADSEIAAYAAHADARSELPPIYQPGDHRELVSKAVEPAAKKLSSEELRATAWEMAKERLAKEPCKCGCCLANLYVEACRSMRVTPGQSLES